MLSVSFIDPFFLYNDHYRAYSNITDRFPEATFPYQATFRSYPQAISVLRFIKGIENGDPLPQVIIFGNLV